MYKNKVNWSLASAQRPVKMGFNRQFILTSNDLAVTVYLLSFFPLENGYWRQWISRKCVFFAIHNLLQDHWAISGSDRLFTLFVLLHLHICVAVDITQFVIFGLYFLTGHILKFHGIPWLFHGYAQSGPKRLYYRCCYTFVGQELNARSSSRIELPLFVFARETKPVILF